MQVKHLWSIIILVLIFTPFQSGLLGAFSYDSDIQAGSWLTNLTVPYDYKGDKGTVPVQIYFPRNYKKGEAARTLIALHPYNGKHTSWERYSAIEKYADQYNFVIVTPGMGKTLYEMKYYRETSIKWSPVPGGIFVGTFLLPWVSSTFNLATSKNKTGILGCSSGARGAIAVAQEYNSRFGAVAGLSGSYDPLSMTRDRQLASIYGPYKSFPDRWKKDANLIASADKLRGIPVFLGHAGKDVHVPRGQIIMMALKINSLGRGNNMYSVVIKERKYSRHDWGFWNRMLPQVMEFFNEKLTK